jgi:hypothetical protein
MPPLDFWLSASRQINYLFNPIQHTLTLALAWLWIPEAKAKPASHGFD